MAASTIPYVDGHVEDGAGEEEGNKDAANRIVDGGSWTAAEGCSCCN